MATEFDRLLDNYSPDVKALAKGARKEIRELLPVSN